MRARFHATTLGIALILAFGLGAWMSKQMAVSSNVDESVLPPLPNWALAPLPDFNRYQETEIRKAHFFAFLFPRVVLANARILKLRQHLQALQAKTTLSDRDKQWLRIQCKRLAIDAPIGSLEMYKLLDRRMDIVPPSLVLAQAANESGWGTSRFAREGNNLFGQWCFQSGCGIVPKQRADGASHEVASFGSPYQSIRSYITNLNRHTSYLKLRKMREALRDNNKFPSGISLAKGLGSYSQKGKTYVHDIMGMIRYNNLQYYDEKFKELMAGGLDDGTLSQLAQMMDNTKVPAGTGSTIKSG